MPEETPQKKHPASTLVAAALGVILIGGGIALALLLPDKAPKIDAEPQPVVETEIVTPASPIACAANADTPCGSCGGTISCDGKCSKPTPPSFGQPCGNCGGKTQCDGTCNALDPANFRQSCGSCGGTTLCDGSCSLPTPANFGQSCGRCGGTYACNGACSVADPANLGQACGCGGSWECNGGCSKPFPADFGHACGSCGGVVMCGGCSIATPPNLGQSCDECGTVTCTGCNPRKPTDYGEVVTLSTHRDWISCCSINLARNYGGACTPGYVYETTERTQHSGRGYCEVEEHGSGRSCSIKTRWQNRGLEGADCEFTIKQKRVCN